MVLQIDRTFEKMSREADWTEEAVRSSTAWADQRERAREVLRVLGEPRDESARPYATRLNAVIGWGWAHAQCHEVRQLGRLDHPAAGEGGVWVALARPTGVGRALATYEIPIEGRDEWLAAARRLA